MIIDEWVRGERVGIVLGQPYPNFLRDGTVAPNVHAAKNATLSNVGEHADRAKALEAIVYGQFDRVLRFKRAEKTCAIVDALDAEVFERMSHG